MGVHVQIYTDHQGLQYFNTKKRLNSRQAAWYLELSAFDFVISYRPGKSMGKPDAIIRRSGDEKSGIEERMFADGQLQSDDKFTLEELYVIDENVPEDVELTNIDCSNWPKTSNGLLV